MSKTIPCNVCQTNKKIKVYYEMESYHVHNRELKDNISVPKWEDGSLKLITEKFPVYICSPCGKKLHLEDHWEKNLRYPYCILCLSLHDCPQCFGPLKDPKKEFKEKDYVYFNHYVMVCPHCNYDFWPSELPLLKK